MKTILVVKKTNLEVKSAYSKLAKYFNANLHDNPYIKVIMINEKNLENHGYHENVLSKLDIIKTFTEGEDFTDLVSLQTILQTEFISLGLMVHKYYCFNTKLEETICWKWKNPTWHLSKTVAFGLRLRQLDNEHELLLSRIEEINKDVNKNLSRKHAIEQQIVVGLTVRIKSGASEWMMERNMFPSFDFESIDGYTGVITKDYTRFNGDDKHYGVKIGDSEIGIHPQFIEFDSELILNNIICDLDDNYTDSNIVIDKLFS